MERGRSPAADSHPGKRPGRRVLVTPRDRAILDMAAEHRLILPGHAAALLGVTADTAGARLRRLTRAGYLGGQRIFAGQTTCFQITRRGLDVIDSNRPRPHVDLRAYAHDVGLAWLWLAARRGSFGPMREVLSERTLRSLDGQRLGVGPAPTSDGGRASLGIRLPGTGPRGRARLHYPDLLLVTPEGRRVAVELELSSKGRRVDGILAAYGAEPRIDAVLYLVDRPAIAQAIRSSARRLGVSSLVHLQWIRQSPARGPSAVRAADRQPAARER